MGALRDLRDRAAAIEHETHAEVATTLAGELDEIGQYSADTLNGKVSARLRAFAKRLAKLTNDERTQN